MIASAGERLKTLEPSHIAGGNEKQDYRCVKQSDSFPKVKNSAIVVTQQFHSKVKPKTHPHKHCTQMSIEALSIIVKK